MVDWTRRNPNPFLDPTQAGLMNPLDVQRQLSPFGLTGAEAYQNTWDEALQILRDTLGNTNPAFWGPTQWEAKNTLDGMLANGPQFEGEGRGRNRDPLGNPNPDWNRGGNWQDVYGAMGPPQKSWGQGSQQKSLNQFGLSGLNNFPGQPKMGWYGQGGSPKQGDKWWTYFEPKAKTQPVGNILGKMGGF